jgi:hypothetical protein
MFEYPYMLAANDGATQKLHLDPASTEVGFWKTLIGFESGNIVPGAYAPVFAEHGEELLHGLRLRNNIRNIVERGDFTLFRDGLRY